MLIIETIFFRRNSSILHTHVFSDLVLRFVPIFECVGIVDAHRVTKTVVLTVFGAPTRDFRCVGIVLRFTAARW